jgi:hypothetical protein
MKNRQMVGGLFLFAALTAACATAPPQNASYVRMRPPRAVVEIRTQSPGPGHVWISGNHRWDGNGYSWTAGRWEQAPAGRRSWTQGRWRSYNGQWYWIEGHWS